MLSDESKCQVNQLSQFKLIHTFPLMFFMLVMPFQALAKDDPLEPLNRFVFKINDTLDVYLIVPVTKVYQQVTPDFLETRVANFFDNLDGVTSILNSFAQLKVKKGLRHTGQFAINSTAGLLGLFNVARHIGLDEDPEDFGQTLAYWHVPSGPYLVLPVFGPSTIRDAAGLGVDHYSYPLTYARLSQEALAALYGLDLVSTRAELLKFEAILTGDRYEMMRELYLQSREFDILDGEIIDDFSNDENDGDGEFLDESF